MFVTIIPTIKVLNMSKVNELLENAISFKKELDNTMQAAFEKGKALLSEALKAIFEEYPQIESISWTQYTPYFNDGDSCEFSVNTWDIELNEEEDDTYSEEKSKIENAKEIRQLVSKFLQTIGDDSLEDLGEGKVVALRNGTLTVEEYDHD